MVVETFESKTKKGEHSQRQPCHKNSTWIIITGTFYYFFCFSTYICFGHQPDSHQLALDTLRGRGAGGDMLWPYAEHR